MKKLIAMSLLIFTLIQVNIYGNQEVKADVDKPKAEKVVYLTFDDGPSNNTAKVLEVLEKNNIKATFFVIGEKALEFPQVFNKQLKSGNSINVHTYNHKYCNYCSESEYFKDLNKCIAEMKKLGWTERDLIRFPGGSCNKFRKTAAVRAIRTRLVENGYNYMDWNVSSEDAVSGMISPNQILKNVKKDHKFANSDTVVVLMHDGELNKTAGKGLEKVIDFYKDEGYTFKIIDENTTKDEFQRLKDIKLINKFNQDKISDKDNKEHK